MLFTYENVKYKYVSGDWVYAVRSGLHIADTVVAKALGREITKAALASGISPDKFRVWTPPKRKSVSISSKGSKPKSKYDLDLMALDMEPTS